MSLFSQAEAKRIADVIGEVERRTAGELVVAEEERSDDYAEVRLAWASELSLATAAVVHLIFPTLATGVLLALQLTLLVAIWLLTALPSVLRPLLPRARSSAAVMRAARLSFLNHGVFRTRDRTGVLIFLSSLEHKVVILGDEGIHARVQDAGWDALVAQLVKAIRERRAGEGVCAVIEQLGQQLASAAPIRPEDENELANHVRGPGSGG